MGRNKSIGGLTPAITIAGGYVAARLASKFLANVPILNSTIGQLAFKGVAGIYLMSNSNATAKGLGTGMLVNAVTDVVGMAVPALNAGSVSGIQPVNMAMLREKAAFAAQERVPVANGVSYE